jgi:choline/glycine/proline betaine transport protein
MKPNIHPIVFLTSACLIILFVFLGAAFTDTASQVFETLQDAIVSHLGWLYIIVVALFLVFVLWLWVSPFGRVRLGKDDDRPEYHNATWFAMLFSAGMGIGLLFFSVAEPMLHFTNPLYAEPETIEAAQDAMILTFLHWGLHAWAIYIIIGLALAYFSYRHDLPLTIRSTLYPLLGKRINGSMGHVVEIMAVLGTLFGVATSLGLGAMQINSGLNFLGILDLSTTNQLILIALITVAATASVASGLDRGVRRLSQLNLGLGLLLVTFVFVVGPTVFLLSSFVESIGRYLQNLLLLTFQTDAFHGTLWQGDWTMFYWAWWIAWSPFVGMFIARISRGRTIRGFIGGVLLVPTMLTFIWLVVFGNTAIHFEMFGPGGIAAAVEQDTSVALFALLEQLPLATITIVLSTLVIATFFVTSSDSGSLVIDILTSGGRRPRPAYQRVFWALVQGGVAVVLLLAGGLLALQTAVLTMALPFSIIMVVICYSLVKGLRTERSTGRVGPVPGPPLVSEAGREVAAQPGPGSTASVTREGNDG